MTDVESVVAQLKLTTKGRLSYNDKNWNAVLGETSAVPKLNIPSFIVRNHRIGNRNAMEESKKKQNAHYYDHKAYYSSETTRRKCVSETSQSMAKETKSPPPKVHNKPFDTLPNSSTYLLQDVDQEYDDLLISMSNLRTQNMKTKLKCLEVDHQKQLNMIDKGLGAKYRQESQDVLIQQNEVENVDEMYYFDQIKRNRQQIAQEKAQQLQLHLQKIQVRKIQLDERKKALLEKKKYIGKLAERVAATLAHVMQEFKKNQAMYTLPESYMQIVNYVVANYQQCTSIISSAMEKNAVDMDAKSQLISRKLQAMEECSKKCDEIAQKLKAEKEVIVKKKEEEEAKQKASAAAPTQVSTITATPSSVQASVIATPTTTNAIVQQATPSGTVPSIEEATPRLIPLKSAINAAIDLLSHKPSFESFLKLQKHLLDTEKIHQPFSTSKEKTDKTYKFDLYKVVNTQINSISNESPKHLMEKIMKLNTLLTEGEVLFSGKPVTAKGNPMALALVKDLIAKKLVLQGQLQVASSFKAAFPIAAVCVGLWSLFPDLGDLLLGHFYNKCPLLVPFYIPKTDNITTVEYFKLVGYEVDGETVEDEDKFLNKLSGTVRLYAAMMQMDIPPQLGNRAHPFGIEHAWMWFTRLMNLEPRPSITATVIFDFLEVAGYALMKRFGKQFRKVLLTLWQDLMPKILKVTPVSSKAGAMRLKMFLETCVKDGKIKPPDGVLTERWWNTGY